MNIREIIAGLFWLIVGNLVFYLVYPLYGSMIDGFGTSVVGEFGLTNTIVAIGWGGYLLMWIGMGIVMPLYLVLKGAGRE